MKRERCGKHCNTFETKKARSPPDRARDILRVTLSIGLRGQFAVPLTLSPSEKMRTRPTVLFFFFFLVRQEERGGAV